MAHRFKVGEAVEYSPIGRSVGHFIVMRQMPYEDRDGVAKYQIRNVVEGFERIASEPDLKATDQAASAYTDVPARR